MKNILISFLCTLFYLAGTAQLQQAPDWQWIRSGGGTSPVGSLSYPQSTIALGSDAAGNIYGISTTEGNIIIDTIQTPIIPSYSNICVYSYRCDGSFRWMRNFASSFEDLACGMIVNSNGDVYISGHVKVSQYGFAYFGDSIIPPTNNMAKHAFIAKIDSSGHTVGLSLPGSSPVTSIPGYLLKMEKNNQGNLAILCWINDSATISGIHIPKGGYYILTFSSNNLNLIQSISLDFSYPSNSYINHHMYFTFDNDNSIYITAEALDTFYIGSDTLIKSAQYTYLLFKLNQNGQKIWYKVIDGTYNDTINPYNKISGKPVVVGKKVFVVGQSQTFSSSHFYSIPIINPLIKFNNWNTDLIASFNKIDGSFISMKNFKFITGFVNLLIGKYKNDELVAVAAGGQLVILNQSDTVKPYSTNLNFPLVVSIDTNLSHFNWGKATKMLYINSWVNYSSMHIDNNDNIWLGGTLKGDVLNSAGDTTICWTGQDFFIAKVAYTNDSCNCHPPIPSLKMLSSANNVLNIAVSATGGPDSLLVLWGDGSSSIYYGQNTQLSHTYTSSGPWNVCLKAFGFCGSKDICLNNLFSGMPSTSSNSLSMSIYPNPFSQSFTVELSDYSINTEIQIFDLPGKMVYTSHFDGKSTTINTKELPAGVYLIKLIYQDGNSVVKKIVKSL